MSSCDCEPSDVWNQVSRRARKPYECCECSAPIVVGETYVYVSWLYDGHWGHERLCERCSDRYGQYRSLTSGYACCILLTTLYDWDAACEAEPIWAFYQKDAGRRAKAELEIRDWATRMGLLVKWRLEDHDSSCPTSDGGAPDD